MPNSAEAEQTVPDETVCSGSTLFALTFLSKNIGNIKSMLSIISYTCAVTCPIFLWNKFLTLKMHEIFKFYPTTSQRLIEDLGARKA